MRTLVAGAMILALVAHTPAPAAVQAAPAPAPAFALALFSGRTLRLTDLRGTGVILLFWANW